jgi:hypothetical protein
VDSSKFVESFSYFDRRAMASFLVALLVVTPTLGLTARMKSSASSGTDDCPIGFDCTPSACEIENSNEKPGLDCACGDGFEGSITWKSIRENGGQYHKPEGSCNPAPCGLVGTIGDGPECQCIEGLHGKITWSGSTPSGECLVEAKALFTEGEELTWNVAAEKAYKCCVSSAGNPTILQDMNSELPKSGGIVGGGGRLKATGCGYMFGEGYHNGLKPYNKLIDMKGVSREATCPVPIQIMMDKMGAGLDDVMVVISSKMPREEDSQIS